jgi:hypothetical protein
MAVSLQHFVSSSVVELTADMLIRILQTGTPVVVSHPSPLTSALLTVQGAQCDSEVGDWAQQAL